MPPIKDPKSLPRPAIPENPLHRADRLYNSPIVDLVDKAIEKAGGSPHYLRTKIDDATVNRTPNTVERDPQVRANLMAHGLPIKETGDAVAQTLSKTSPAHAVAAATLGTGTVGAAANGVLALHGGYKLLDPNSTLAERAGGALDLGLGGFGAVHTGSRVVSGAAERGVKAAEEAAKGKQALDEAMTAYKGVRGNKIMTPLEEIQLLKSDPKFQPILDQIRRSPADRFAKQFQPEGFRRADIDRDLSMNEAAQVHAKEQKEAASDIQAQADLEKGRQDELNTTDKQFQKAVGAKRNRIAEEAKTERGLDTQFQKALANKRTNIADDLRTKKGLSNDFKQALNAKDSRTAAEEAQKAKDATQEARNLDARDAALKDIETQTNDETARILAEREAATNQTEIESRKAALEPSTTVTEQIKGEPGKSSTVTYREPRGEGGEGGDGGDIPGVTPSKPIFTKFTRGEGGATTAKILADKLKAQGLDVDVKPLPNGGALVHTRGFGENSSQPFSEAEIRDALGVEGDNPGGEIEIPAKAGSVIQPETPLEVPPSEAAIGEGATGAGGEVSPAAIPNGTAKSAKLAETKNGADQLEQILGDKDIPIPNGKGALPAEAPVGDEPTFTPLNPQTGEIQPSFRISPLRKAGIEYDMAQGLKKAGLTTEDNRATAGRVAAQLNTPANRSNLTLDDIQTFPENVRANYIKQLTKDDPGQKGEIVNPLLFRMGSTSLGAGAGAYEDENNRGRGALIGGLMGFAAPSIGEGVYKAVADAQPGDKAGNFLRELARVRNSLLLGPTSIGHKVFGDAQSLALGALENPERAGDIAKGLFTPSGITRRLAEAKEGLTTNPEETYTGASQFINDPRNPLSWSGRAMSGATRATKGALGEAGLDDAEQARLTMTGLTSKSGNAVYNYIKNSPTLTYTTPLARMMIARLERGIEYSPLGSTQLFNPKVMNNLSPQEKVWKGLLRPAVGTLAFTGGAAEGYNDPDFIKNHPLLAGAETSGPLGLPVLAGIGAGKYFSNHEGIEDNDKLMAHAMGAGASSAMHDVPALDQINSIGKGDLVGLARNHLSGYTNALRTAAELQDPHTSWKTFPPEKATYDTSSDDLSLRQQLLNRALSNVPFVRPTLPILEEPDKAAVPNMFGF